jgi:hypothetical protein
MQERFCVCQFCVVELITIFEISRPTQPTMKSYQLINTALRLIKFGITDSTPSSYSIIEMMLSCRFFDHSQKTNLCSISEP